MGAAALAAMLIFTLVANRGSRVRLEGKIIKVRTEPLDDTSSAIVLDFRVTNHQKPVFIVRDVAVSVTKAGGQTINADTVSEMDAQRFFDAYPQIGAKFNQSLMARTRLATGETIDRMIAVRVDLPHAEVLKRKNLYLRIVDADGEATVIHERPD